MYNLAIRKCTSLPRRGLNPGPGEPEAAILQSDPARARYLKYVNTYLILLSRAHILKVV